MKVSVMDLPDIFTLLASNTKALGVRKAIHSLTENGPTKYKDEFRFVFEQMEESKTLSTALEETELFDLKTLAVIRANEAAGKLDTAFSELAKIAKFQRKAKREIDGTLGKPALSFILFLGVALFLAQGIFSQLAQRDKTGDWFLTIMGQLGNFVRDNTWIYAVVVLGAWYGIKVLRNSDTVARFCVNLFMQLPAIGDVLKTQQIGIWCRFASLMADSGMLVLDIKKSLSSVLSETYQEGLEAVFDDVSAGRSWPIATNPSSWAPDDPRHKLPHLFLSYVSAAGDTGDWADKMNEAADTFMESYENAVESTKPAIEAVSIGVIMLPIGFMVFQLFSNIYGGAANGF